MLPFAKDCAAINIVQEFIKFIGLVREAAFVEKDVLRFSPTLWLGAYWDSAGLCA